MTGLKVAQEEQLNATARYVGDGKKEPMKVGRAQLSGSLRFGKGGRISEDDPEDVSGPSKIPQEEVLDFPL